MSRTIEYHGLAATWGHFTTLSGGRHRFARHALDRFAGSSEASCVPLWLQHDAGMSIDMGSQRLQWSVDHDGLWVRFRLPMTTARNRAAASAIDCGWLPGLSLGFNILSADEVPGADPYTQIYSLFVEELSIVSAPGNRDACLCRVGQPVQRTRRLPERAADRIELSRLLRDLGIDPSPGQAPRHGALASSSPRKPIPKTTAPESLVLCVDGQIFTAPGEYTAWLEAKNARREVCLRALLARSATSAQHAPSGLGSWIM